LSRVYELNAQVSEVRLNRDLFAKDFLGLTYSFFPKRSRQQLGRRFP